MSKLPISTAYCSRETLADLLDLKPGAIDQLVKRGILPQPVTIGEAIRWKWTAVEEHLASTPRIDADEDADPYTKGLRNGQPRSQSLVSELSRFWQDSPQWARISPSTQAEWGRLAKRIVSHWGLSVDSKSAGVFTAAPARCFSNRLELAYSQRLGRDLTQTPQV